MVELAARHGPNFNYIVYHNEYTRYGESWPVHDPSAVSGRQIKNMMPIQRTFFSEFIFLVHWGLPK